MSQNYLHLINIEQISFHATHLVRLQNNNLMGTIPSNFAKMSHLEHLQCSNNRLSGVIPSAFSSLQNLGEFWLRSV